MKTLRVGITPSYLWPPISVKKGKGPGTKRFKIGKRAVSLSFVSDNNLRNKIYGEELAAAVLEASSPPAYIKDLTLVLGERALLIEVEYGSEKPSGFDSSPVKAKEIFIALGTGNILLKDYLDSRITYWGFAYCEDNFWAKLSGEARAILAELPEERLTDWQRQVASAL